MIALQVLALVVGQVGPIMMVGSSDYCSDGSCDGALTSTSLTCTATIQGEQLTSTDDADVNDSLTCGDLVIDEAAGVLNFTGATSATISATSGLLNTPPLVVGGDAFLADDVLPAVSSVATDAAPVVSVIQAENPYQSPTSVASTYRNGGDIVLAPGQGKVVIGEIVPATVAGKTITLTVTAQGVTSAGVTKTEGVNFNCAGLTAAQCALALYDMLKSGGTSPVTGCLPTCIDGTCSNGQISLTSVPGTSERCAFATNDSTAFPLTSGDRGLDGQVIIGVGSVSAPAIAPLGDKDTGFYWSSENTLGLTSGGVSVCGLGVSGVDCRGGSAGVRGNYVSTSTSFMAYTYIGIDTLPIQWAYGGGGYWGTKYVSLGPSAATPFVRAADGANTGAGGYQVLPQTITCADSGDGNHSTCGGAQTISSNVVQLVCLDADGATLTLAETNWSATASGQVTIVGPAANHVDLTDSAGVLELDGGAAFAMVALDTLDLVYAPAATAWVERNRHTDL